MHLSSICCAKKVIRSHDIPSKLQAVSHGLLKVSTSPTPLLFVVFNVVPHLASYLQITIKTTNQFHPEWDDTEMYFLICSPSQQVDQEIEFNSQINFTKTGGESLCILFFQPIVMSE